MFLLLIFISNLEVYFGLSLTSTIYLDIIIVHWIDEMRRS